jgi:hypothetical protein
VPDAVAERQVLDVLLAAKIKKIQPTAYLLASVTILARVVVYQNGTMHVPTHESHRYP